MGTPPKISDLPVREAHVEVLPPEPARSEGQTSAPPISAPIHALSALVLVAVDSLWAVFDFVPPIWLIAIPGCFLACFVPVYLIQRHLRRDTPQRALAIATLLAVLAAIPTPITGTPIGVGLLAWTGLGKLLGKQKQW